VNFLEQLVAEWYRYTGHFVRTNVRFEKRAKGGWAGEIDVLAYLPQRGNVSHIEISMDADSWPERKKKFTRSSPFQSASMTPSFRQATAISSASWWSGVLTTRIQ
jgi:hypothetical protein